MREPGAVGTRVARSFVRFGQVRSPRPLRAHCMRIPPHMPSPAYLACNRQLELFARRNEVELLAELAEHTIDREFPQLRSRATDAATDAATDDVAGGVAAVTDAVTGGAARASPRQLLEMFSLICTRQAALMAEWGRVGYCQVRAPASPLPSHCPPVAFPLPSHCPSIARPLP